jgi:putative ABC transport system substrate-binding protein
MDLGKKIFLSCSLIGNLVLAVFAGSLCMDTLNKRRQLYEVSADAPATGKKVSIVIIYAEPCPGADAIIKGFKKELAQEPGIKPVYHLYDHGPDRQALRAQIEDVIQKDFDLIFTIGEVASCMVATLTARRQCRTPVVFAAVQDPVHVKSGIVPRERDRSCFITGSSSDTTERHEQRFSLLRLLKPTIPRVLIPYDSDYCDVVVQRNIANAATFMEDQGIPVKKIGISLFGTSFGRNYVEGIAACIKEGDVIWIPRNSTRISYIRSIVQLARDHHAIIYASDADAIADGATFAFVADDQAGGYNAGKKAREILVRGKHPSEVPITSPVGHYSLWVNESLLEPYGLTIDERLLFLMERTNVVRGDDHL